MSFASSIGGVAVMPADRSMSAWLPATVHWRITGLELTTKSAPPPDWVAVLFQNTQFVTVALELPTSPSAPADGALLPLKMQRANVGLALTTSQAPPRLLLRFDSKRQSANTGLAPLM